MRLFIASKVHIFDYASLQKRFAPTLRGKWIEAHNLHLTWYFIGDAMSPEATIEKMRSIEKSLTEPVALQDIGTFGSPPRVLFASSDVKILYAQADKIAEAGFVNKRFRPHATLCRIKALQDHKRFEAACRHFEKEVLGKILPEITLYRSHLGDKGPHYEALYTL